MLTYNRDRNPVNDLFEMFTANDVVEHLEHLELYMSEIGGLYDTLGDDDFKQTHRQIAFFLKAALRKMEEKRTDTLLRRTLFLN